MPEIEKLIRVIHGEGEWTMVTQAERKRQLANRLRDEAEKINHTNSMRINQHLYIPDLPYGKSLVPHEI